MNAQKVREILKSSISADNGLYNLGWYIGWNVHDEEACLDGDFTAEQLEAIVWWMRNWRDAQTEEKCVSKDDTINPPQLYKDGICKKESVAPPLLVRPDKEQENKFSGNNPCEEHFDFKGDFCPVCLMEERDSLTSHLAAKGALLEEAKKALNDCGCTAFGPPSSRSCKEIMDIAREAIAKIEESKHPSPPSPHTSAK